MAQFIVIQLKTKGFTELLNNILSEMNKSHANYFILSDVNINTDKFATASNYSSDYLNMLTSNSVTSLITKPTRVAAPSTATIIDHVFTNENCLILTPFAIKYTLTDHYPIMISVSQKTNNTCKNQCKLVRSISKFAVEEFIKDLIIKFSEFWQKIPTITDKNIETIFEQFYTLITQNIDKHAPLKKASRKQKRLQNKPWITKGLYKSIKRKEKNAQNSLYK